MQRLLSIGLATVLLGCGGDTETADDKPKQSRLAESVLGGGQTTAPAKTPTRETPARPSASQPPLANPHVPTPSSEPRPPASKTPAVQMPDLPERPLYLTYLPPRIDVAISLRLSELWKAPAMKSLVAEGGPLAQNPLIQFTGRIGLAPQDIESITLGAYGLTDTLELGRGSAAARPTRGARGNRSRGANSRSRRDGAAIFVVRTHEAQGFGAVLAGVTRSEPVVHSGRTYYRLFAEGLPQSFSVFFAEEKVAVFGREEDLKAMMDDLDVSHPPVVMGMTTTNANRHIVIEFSTRMRSLYPRLFNQYGAADPNASSLGAVIKRHVVRFGVSIHAEDRCIGQIQLESGNEPAAAGVLKALDTARVQGHAVGTDRFASSPQPLPRTIAAIVESGQAAQNDYAVTVTAAIPASALPFAFIATLADLEDGS